MSLQLDNLAAPLAPPNCNRGLGSQYARLVNMDWHSERHPTHAAIDKPVADLKLGNFLDQNRQSGPIPVWHIAPPDAKHGGDIETDSPALINSDIESRWGTA